ncbi:hypothetical protein SD71_02180 [Cohnella kolymensis]|uniref:DUF2663 family protein n=1 Tax=Cohnella kolymensis TaxID=1590652 RepID=A0ABR5A8T1_9BACL|nr:DUF2663 family protein [Cohnella kolymensis]KIL37469.1 hypothetical protein SD71_02180 [Cohnella kolymensis]
MSVNKDPDLSDLNLPNDIIMMIKELMKRKDKLDHAKFLNTSVSMISLMLVFVLVIWMNKIGSLNVQGILSAFANPISFYSIFFMIALLIYSRSLSVKHKKAKDKYEDLRKEVVTRLDADWVLNYRSNKRDKLSERLSSKDINIRFKN